MSLDAMIEAARTVRERAHAPYSNFHVGACIRGKSGALYAACNVENAAYPQGQCAEASAIGAVGTPVVSLFGPTDARWTTIPFKDEIVMSADPELPEEEVANDHPERCKIDRIKLGDVVASVNSLLNSAPIR